eukprot:NODE_380_length_1818_cov_64.484454_g320_i0.p2 GENE.NODE_380_length_1818_cov_64.484454_g320_i0~~NODE_380_length_1818_cov_64.484454_g320_i0.p2  ORF type:complete len:209 (+),score=65.31 NODE_380_length_1818_cov_64.484454_g320_i0:90-629(+)
MSLCYILNCHFAIHHALICHHFGEQIKALGEQEAVHRSDLQQLASSEFLEMTHASARLLAVANENAARFDQVVSEEGLRMSMAQAEVESCYRATETCRARQLQEREHVSQQQCCARAAIERLEVSLNAVLLSDASRELVVCEKLVEANKQQRNQKSTAGGGGEGVEGRMPRPAPGLVQL